MSANIEDESNAPGNTPSMEDEIKEIGNIPKLVWSDKAFLLAVLQEDVPPSIWKSLFGGTKIPDSVNGPFNDIPRGLLDIWSKLLAALNESAPLNTKCRKQIVKALHVRWAFTEKAVEQRLRGAQNPEPKDPKEYTGTLVTTLGAIIKWAKANCGRLGKSEEFLRDRAVEFLNAASYAISESSPKIGAEYERRCHALRTLVKCAPCKFDAAQVYTIRRRLKGLTIVDLSHNVGRASALSPLGELRHLADWNLEKLAAEKGETGEAEIKYLISPKVLSTLRLTEKVVDGDFLTLDREKGATCEWSILKHRTMKPARYAILSDYADCFLSFKEQAPFIDLLNSEDEMWVWEIEASKTK